MKLLYTLTLLTLCFATLSCGDEDVALPDGYADSSLDVEAVNSILPGRWNRYSVVRTTYTQGQEFVQQLGTMNGDFRFEVSDLSEWVPFTSYNFPNMYRTFEVQQYGERFSFYDRQYQQHTNFVLTKISPTEVVFTAFESPYEGYYVVTEHTLMR